MAAGEVVLVTGGARSGKSHWAEKIAASLNQDVVYIATAGVHDHEMEERVRRHRARRPASWKTVEETHTLAGAMQSLSSGSVVLIDCLTLWITNILLDSLKMPTEEIEESILKQVNDMISLARHEKHHLIMVSNEVGWGLVPDNELGRAFRDIAGRVNQMVAELADKVFLVVAGIPLELKSMAANCPGKVI